MCEALKTVAAFAVLVSCTILIRLEAAGLADYVFELR
jgi:hypothetical protein